VTLPDDLPVLAFESQAAFEEWLEAHHADSPGIYVKIAKKGSGEASLTQQQMVESMLCFGWIDGRANRLDDTHFLQRVTPRRPKSPWSQRNVEWVGRLVEAGRMRPAGLAAVEAARADGRWEQAYAGPATITVPDDLAAALAAEPEAQQTFDALNRTNRYAVLWRVHTARTPTGRAKRIASLVEMLAKGEQLHP
jgi:uncharacterized protein YdeI (YjbR/CyaY-like superfamily)